MKNDPRAITAKFYSKCPETGKDIIKGDTCIYYPIAKKAFHVDSKQAAAFYAGQVSDSQGYYY